MRSMIRESIKEMREIGVRCMEIERIRYRLREDIVYEEESVYMGRVDIRYRAVDDCSGWGIWCNQSVTVLTENNPN